MKIKFSLFFTLFFILLSTAAYSTSEFVLGMEDVPLFPNLKEDSDASSVYDTETGKIVDSIYYSKDIVYEEVAKFYEESLPQLGWERVSVDDDNNFLVYRRDNEELEIDFVEEETSKFVRFFLYPL